MDSTKLRVPMTAPSVKYLIRWSNWSTSPGSLCEFCGPRAEAEGLAVVLLRECTDEKTPRRSA